MSQEENKWDSTFPKELFQGINENCNGFVLLRFGESYEPEIFIQSDGPGIQTALTIYLADVSKMLLKDDGDFRSKLSQIWADATDPDDGGIGGQDFDFEDDEDDF